MVRVALMAVLLVLSGCLSDGGSDAEHDDTGASDAEDPQGTPEPLVLSLEDCFEVGWLRNSPLEDLQRLLPDGFVAERAAELAGAGVLGAPGIARQVPADVGFIAVGAFSCENRADTEAPFSFANYAIYIEPPVVPGHENSPVEVNWYLLLYPVTDEDLAAALGPMGFPALQATFDMGINYGPATDGWASATNTTGLLFDFQLQGHTPAAGGDDQESHRFWYDDTNGLSYITQVLEPRNLAVAAVTACTAPQFDIMFQSCEPSDWGILVAPTDATLTYVQLPGATLAP